jgi:hypothetical protein
MNPDGLLTGPGPARYYGVSKKPRPQTSGKAPADKAASPESAQSQTPANDEAWITDQALELHKLISVRRSKVANKEKAP